MVAIGRTCLFLLILVPSLVLLWMACQIFFFKNWAFVIHLIQLLLSNVDEKPVKAAHTRVTLLLTSCLTGSEVMISCLSMISAVPAVACSSADAIVRETRAKAKVLVGPHRSRCLWWWENRCSLLSWLGLASVDLRSLLLVSRLEDRVNTWSGSLLAAVSST